MSRYQRRPRLYTNHTGPVNLKNIFELIRDEKMVVEHLASNWVILYRDNDSEAYINLVIFLLESMGQEKNLINSHDLESLDMEAVLEKIMKKAKDVEEYPIISKTKQFKSFYLNFQHFWIYLATESGETLYDESFLTFITNWLSSFTFINYKCIRHTSTLALLSLAQALVDILAKETSDLVRIQTFIRTEMNNSDTQRLHHLQTQEKEISAKEKILNRELENIFNEVLKFRCMDIVLEIRSICLQGLHYMTEKFAEKFLNEDTLKVLSFCLYDKSSEVRLKAMTFIQNIFVDGNIGRLQGFFESNRSRIVEMSHDIDTKVCVIAITVATRLANASLLSKDEENIVSCLIWAENEEIRNAACNFLLQAVFKDKLPLDHGYGVSMSIDQGRQFDSERAIMKLVNFHKEFEETDICRIEIVVQTLWNKTSVVKSWEAMCELLKRGERSNTTSLEDTDRRIIIYMLISGLKFIHATSDKKQKHVMVALTSTLLTQLPSLLVFYSNEIETLKELIKIPMYLDLSALSAKDLKDPFVSLLGILMDLLGKINSAEIIFKATQSLAKLAREPHSLQKDAKTEIVKLASDVCLGLKKTLSKFTLEGEETDLDKWMLRAESLISVYDILDDIASETFADLTGIISQYLSNSVTNVKVATHAAGILYFYHLWDLNKITKHPEGLEKYSEARNSIIEFFTAIVAKPDCDDNLKYITFKYLCETLMVVSSQAAFGSPLHYEVSKDIWTTIEEFMLSMPIRKVKPVLPVPAKAFYKLGAKDEPIKEDADEVSQTISLLVGRIVSFCPSITTSHLPSSFLASFGTCSLKSINSIVKQVIVYYKTKESQQSGVFSDQSLYFSIVLESLIKAMGSGTDEEISKMKELSKKFANVMGNGPMRPKQADRFLGFIVDGISFAFSDKDNFQILDGLNVFLQKNYLSPNQMKELYDRVSKDADTIESKIKQHHEGDIQVIMFPIKQFLYCVGRLVGVMRQPPVLPSEKTKKQINKRREELYKKPEETQAKPLAVKKSVGIKKSAFSIIDEYKNSENPEANSQNSEEDSKSLNSNIGNSDMEQDFSQGEDIEIPFKKPINEDEIEPPIIKSIKKSALNIVKPPEPLSKAYAEKKIIKTNSENAPAIKKSSIRIEKIAVLQESLDQVSDDERADEYLTKGISEDLEPLKKTLMVKKY